MKRFNTALVVAAFAVVMSFTVTASASEDTPKPMQGTANLTGLHDFDFLVGNWQVHHRKLKDRLVNSHDWAEFDGTLSVHKLMDGFGNVSDNWFNIPGGAYRGVGLRSYNQKTGQWAIWWLDGRDPFGTLDPPVIGRFMTVNGVGAFYSDEMLRGKPIKVRLTWSHITPTSAHWEQAFSPDGGKTWETNWISDFKRTP